MFHRVSWRGGGPVSAAGERHIAASNQRWNTRKPPTTASPVSHPVPAGFPTLGRFPKCRREKRRASILTGPSLDYPTSTFWLGNGSISGTGEADRIRSAAEGERFDFIREKVNSLFAEASCEFPRNGAAQLRGISMLIPFFRLSPQRSEGRRKSRSSSRARPGRPRLLRRTASGGRPA